VADGGGDRPRSVTSALINAKLDTIIDELREIKDMLKDHETRIRALEQSNARHNERLGLVGALNLIVAAVGAWIGSRR